MRAFFISFVAIVIALFFAARVYWDFFTVSLKFSSLGQAQSCFGAYVAVLSLFSIPNSGRVLKAAWN